MMQAKATAASEAVTWYSPQRVAADLAAVVDFYDGRFAMGLSAQDKTDLVAFLRSL
jgi:hypothetical protein